MSDTLKESFPFPATIPCCLGGRLVAKDSHYSDTPSNVVTRVQKSGLSAVGGFLPVPNSNVFSAQTISTQSPDARR
jgi:hypothetical protein